MKSVTLRKTKDIKPKYRGKTFKVLKEEDSQYLIDCAGTKTFVFKSQVLK